MKKGIGTPENREMAFRVWALLGGKDIPRILYRLEKEHGLKISTKTLYEWKQEGDWEGRMARDEAARDGQGLLTFRERMLRRVMGLIGKYEQQFEADPSAMDNQAAYAYTNLVRTALDLSGKMKPWESRDPEEVKDGPPRSSSINQ